MHPCSMDELEIIRYRMDITIALYIHIDRVRAGHLINGRRHACTGGSSQELCAQFLVTFTFLYLLIE